MTSFSGVTMDFVRCITPVRSMVEKLLVLMSWTSPLKTLGFLASVSFFVYFADLILIILGLLLWTKARNTVLGYLITVQLPVSSDNLIEDFKKNLAFIQMLESSWVDLVTAVEDSFRGVDRSRIKKFVSVMKLLPILGIILTFQFSKSSRAVLILLIWVVGIICHPLGMELLIDLLKGIRSRFEAKVNQIREKAKNKEAEIGATLQKPAEVQDRCYGVGPQQSIAAGAIQKGMKTSDFLLATEAPVNHDSMLLSSIVPQQNQTQAPKAAETKQQDGNLVRDVVVYENQRWWLGVGFRAQFILNESYAWTDTWNKQLPHKDLIEPMVEQQRWKWVSEWILVVNETTDQQGWAYGTSFKTKELSPKKEFLDVIRRRKWVRKCCPE